MHWNRFRQVLEEQFFKRASVPREGERDKPIWFKNLHADEVIRGVVASYREMSDANLDIYWMIKPKSLEANITANLIAVPRLGD